MPQHLLPMLSQPPPHEKAAQEKQDVPESRFSDDGKPEARFSSDEDEGDARKGLQYNRIAHHNGDPFHCEQASRGGIGDEDGFELSGVVSANESQPVCTLCGERFNVSWDDERSEIVVRDAVMLRYAIYHMQCANARIVPTVFIEQQTQRVTRRLRRKRCSSSHAAAEEDRGNARDRMHLTSSQWQQDHKHE